MKERAYLIEPPNMRQDVSNLSDRYDVEYVFDSRADADVFRDDAEEFFRYMQKWAELNFDVGKDFFVLTGNLTLIVAASMALGKQFPNDRILFLRYDHRLGRYCEVQIPATRGLIV